jgi:putative ABC transport system ATP-binding protein
MELSIRDLTVTSAEGDALLSVSRLDALPGVALGVRGASGAGKSTLLSALMGLAPRASGQVFWGATDLIGLGPKDRATFRRRNMGIVFQDYLLFDTLGAADNAAIQAAFSPRSERAGLAKTARSLLKELGLKALHRPVATFSGGERQRVAVARALAHDPRIVLADEPTASLDAQTGRALTHELLRRVRDRGLTLIVASHDEALLDQMDRVLELDHGKPVGRYA